MLQTGQSVGPWEVEELLAHGSMAQVYRVRHREKGTQAALKHLPLAGAEVREALHREATLQSRLRHRNVVTVHQVIEVEGDPAILMELVGGTTLEDYLARGQPTLDEAEALFGGIAAGVAHAHAHRVVHLDLKPSNVLLAESSEGWVPKVADFGVSTALGAPDGGGMGSPAYAAPERIRGGSRVDARADVFSLGCLLYELCTGRRAFTGTDALVVLDEVVSVRYTPAQQLRPDLPERFVAAIEACLVSDPARRAASPGEVMAILAGDQAATARTGRADQWASLRERAAPLLAAGFALLLLLIALYYSA